MAELIRQFTTEVEGKRFDILEYKVIASTPGLARKSARFAARKDFPTRRAIIKPLEVERKGKAQTKISDFVPDIAQRESYLVTVAIDTE